MMFQTLENHPLRRVGTTSSGSYEDPLDHDEAHDVVVVASRRSLVRLALIAAETGARFQREQIAQDPMDWMLAPRRLFGGAAAIEACLDRDDCMRALLLHGLGLGLDADPGDIDELIADDAEAPDHDLVNRNGKGHDAAAWSGGEHPQLFCSVLAGRRHGGTIHAFDAVVTSSRDEAELLLRLRYGERLAADADTMEGFRPDIPMIRALVSPAMADMLTQIASDPSSPLARGFEVSVEQRFTT